MKTFEAAVGPFRFKFKAIPGYLLKKSVKKAIRFDFSDMGGIVYCFSGRNGYYNYLANKFYSPEGFDFKGVRLPHVGDKRTFVGEFFDLLYSSVYESEGFPYDEGPYEFDRVILEKGDVVLDCGANIGMFSAYAARKGCRVYAFEPVPRIAAYLKKTAELNPGITVQEAALTDRSGGVDIHMDLKNAGESSINNISAGNTYEKITVPGTTIDEFIDLNNIQKVDFIKADIEGAERYMLAGAKNVLRKFAPKLAICKYHLPDDPRVIKEIILDANPTYTIVERWEKIYAFGAEKLF